MVRRAYDEMERHNRVHRDPCTTSTFWNAQMARTNDFIRTLESEREAIVALLLPCCARCLDKLGTDEAVVYFAYRHC